MTTNEDDRDGRISLLDRDEVGDEGKEAFDRLATTRGAVANVFRALANSPGALRTVSQVGEHIRYGSSLDPVLRELAILMVAKERRCQYEWSQHLPVAEELGIDEAVLAKVGTAELEEEPGPLGPAMKYCRLLARGEEVEEATFGSVRGVLNDEQLIDLTVLVGYYRLLADVLVTFRVELEPGVERREFKG